MASKKKTRTIEVPQFEILAAIGSIDEEARTVELIFSTGAPFLRFDWVTGKRYMLKLSLNPKHVRLDRLNSGAPLLDSHSQFSITSMLGAVVPGSAKIEKKQAVATVKLSRRPEVESIWQDIRDGIIRNVSLGAHIYKFEESQSKTEEIPTRTALDWEPFEISLVPMGADDGAKVRASHQAETNPCIVVTHAQEEQMSKPKTPEVQPEPVVQAAPQAPQQPVQEPTIDEAAITLAATKAEGDRRDAIEARALAGINGGLDETVVNAAAATAKADNTTAEKFGETILKMLTAAPANTDGPGPTPHGIELVADEHDKRVIGIEAALLQRATVARSTIQAAAKKAPDNETFQNLNTDGAEFGGMSLFELAKDDLSRMNRNGSVPRNRMKLIGDFFAAAGSYQTTSDFAVALENVLHKVLQAAYETAPDTWSEICSIGSVSDFRAHSRYRTGYFASLDQIFEDGEFTTKTIPDAVKESITALTYGNIVGLSRQAMINDDMGVFNRIAVQVGRAAGLTIEEGFYTLLALNSGLGPDMNDGNPLFDAAHSNLGAGAALSAAAVDADATIMEAQQDSNSQEFLNVRPDILLVPRGLKGTALQINENQTDPDTANSNVKNISLGLFGKVVATPRLSGTRRYMFADPVDIPCIEVAFLNGERNPFLEMRDGWTTDGVEWKVRHDFGIAAVEFRSGLTDAGT